MKRIPSSFELGAYTITVVMLDEVTYAKKHGNSFGEFDPIGLKITLAKPDKWTASTRQIVYQTFWHEFTHALLWVALPKKYTDEALTDQIGHLLAQFNQSAKHD